MVLRTGGLILATRRIAAQSWPWIGERVGLRRQIDHLVVRIVGQRQHQPSSSTGLHRTSDVFVTQESGLRNTRRCDFLTANCADGGRAGRWRKHGWLLRTGRDVGGGDRTSCRWCWSRFAEIDQTIKVLRSSHRHRAINWSWNWFFMMRGVFFRFLYNQTIGSRRTSEREKLTTGNPQPDDAVQ